MAVSFIVGGIGVPRENHRPVASHCQALSRNVVLSTSRPERDSNSQLVICTDYTVVYAFWLDGVLTPRSTIVQLY